MRRINIIAWLLVVGWLFSLFISANCYAEIEWTEKKKLVLDGSPIDVATSIDGKWTMILTPGELAVYSGVEEKIVNRMTLDKSFDKVTYSDADGTLIISSSSEKVVKYIQMEPVYNFSLKEVPFKGAEHAPVTVVVFSDYQCPYCAQLQRFFPKLLAKYPKELKIVLKHFPLPTHPFAKKAAVASLAADIQGKYWEFSQRLFDNSSNLNDAIIRDIAKQLKFDLRKFDNDMKSATVQAIIDRDINEAIRASVEGTPAVFVNGKALRSGNDSELLQMIERELRKNSGTRAAGKH